MLYSNNNICFVCHGEHNLTSTVICCGESHYHSNCFNEYCKQHGKKCQICHKNIDDKLEVINKSVINWNYCYNKLLKWIICIIYTIIAAMGYVMFGQVCKEFNKPYPAQDIVCFTIGAPMCSMLWYAFFCKSGTKEGCLHWIISSSEFTINALNKAGSLTIFLITFSPVLLLISSSISFYHPTYMSYAAVYYIYCFTIWGGGIIMSAIVSIHIIVNIVYFIGSVIKECIMGCVGSCYKECCENCFTTVPVYTAQSGVVNNPNTIHPVINTREAEYV